MFEFSTFFLQSFKTDISGKTKKHPLNSLAIAISPYLEFLMTNVCVKSALNAVNIVSIVNRYVVNLRAAVKKSKIK